MALALILPVSVFAVSKAAVSSSTFAEDFNGTALDPAKWAVQENTNLSGYPAWGGSVQVADGQLFLSSNGTSFPYIHSTVNPFPASGDFSVEFAVTYTCIGDLGCGVMLSNSFPTLNATWHNKIITLWAHDGGPETGVIYIEQFNSLAYKMTVPGFKPSSPQHLYRVVYSLGNYAIYVDGAKVAETASQERPTMIVFGNPPNPEVPRSPQENAQWGYWGWSAFKVDYFKVDALSGENDGGDDDSVGSPRPTQISMSTSSATQEVGYLIDVTGSLTSDGKPVSDAQILLSYAIPGVGTWQPITSVTTDKQGVYSASWLPSATGEFVLKAYYAGDQNYTASYDVRNVSILRGRDKDVFLVESNSTLSSLSFNSTSNEIHFTVSGSSGTTGYVRFIASKELVPDANVLKIFLDDKQVEPSISSAGGNWLVSFSYTHSAHDVVISIPFVTSIPQNEASIDNTFLIASAAIVILALAAPLSFIALFRNRKKKNT